MLSCLISLCLICWILLLDWPFKGRSSVELCPQPSSLLVSWTHSSGYQLYSACSHMHISRLIFSHELQTHGVNGLPCFFTLISVRHLKLNIGQDKSIDSSLEHIPAKILLVFQVLMTKRPWKMHNYI